MDHCVRRAAAWGLGLLLLWGGQHGGMAELGAQAPRNLFINRMEFNVPDPSSLTVVTAAVAAEGNLYILTHDSLQKWALGMEEPISLMKPLPMSREAEAGAPRRVHFMSLFAQGSRVYSLDLLAGDIWLLADGSEGFVPSVAVRLADQPSMATEDGPVYLRKEILGQALAEGVFYLSVLELGQPNGCSAVYRWDFATGKALPPMTDNRVQSMTPYQDGRLLCSLYDMWEPWDAVAQKPKPVQLGLLNPETSEITPLTEVEEGYPSCLVYEASHNTLYYIQNDVVHRWPNLQGPTEIAGYLSLPMGPKDSFGLLADGLCFGACYDGVVIRAIGPEIAAKGAMKVIALYERGRYNRFVEKYPAIPLELGDVQEYTQEGIMRQLASGEADVMVLDTGHVDLARLFAEGSLMDLSGSQAVVAALAAMYPSLAEALAAQGKPYALPITMTARTIAYDPQLWAELGFGEAELPKTMEDLVDFVARWQEDYAPAHQDMVPLGMPQWRMELLNLLNKLYLAQATTEGQPPDFTAPLYTRLLHKINALKEPLPEGWEALNQYEEAYRRQRKLFSLEMPIVFDRSMPASLPFALALEAGKEPLVPTMMQGMVIAAQTAQPENALTFLSEMAGQYDEKAENLWLFPQHNQPVVDRAAGEGELVSAEQIRHYRERIAPYLVLVRQAPFDEYRSDGENPLWDIHRQYLNQELSPEAYAQGLNALLGTGAR